MNEPELATDPKTDPKRVNKAIAYASRLLAMREYSQKTLRQKILGKGFQRQEVDEVIEYLLENDWVSDRRFCEVFVRSKAERGLGLTRIRFELSEKGVADNVLQDVLAELSICWQTTCDEVTAKKSRIRFIEKYN